MSHLRQAQESQQSLSLKTTLQRTSSSQTLSPPSSPGADLPSLKQTPARPTPVRHSLFTRNRPTNSPFNTQSHLPTPASMLPTPHKTPRKRDTAAMESTARILNFNPVNNQSVMPSPRRRAKSRLTLDEDDVVDDNIAVYTDVQDRVPTNDDSEDNPFVGPRKSKPRTRARAQTAPSSSSYHAMDDEDDANDKGILYVFRGKKIFRRFEKKNDEQNDSDTSNRSNESLKRKAGAAATRPLTRSSFKPRLLWPGTNNDNDADEEEALTDIEDDKVLSASASTSFGAVAMPAVPTITPAKKAAGFPATPPSSHRQNRSGAHLFADTKQDDIDDGPTSPAATPKAPKSGHPTAFTAWLRTKAAEDKVAKEKAAKDKATRGEKRHRTSLSESELPPKRNRSAFLGRR